MARAAFAWHAAGPADASRAGWGVLACLGAVALVLTAQLQAQPSAASTAAEFNRAGVELYNDGQYADAIANFLAAYDLVPDNETVRRNLSNAYQASAHEFAQAGDYVYASRLLNQAIGIEPGNAAAYIQLGSYYLQQDLVRDAIFRLEEAVAIEASNLTARELLGDAYYRGNYISEALEQWKWLQSQDPDRSGLAEKVAKALREDAVENHFTRTESRHFRISFDRRNVSGRELNTILTTLERAYLDVGRKLGNVFPPTPIQVIAYDADQFSQVTLLGDHVSGLYDGKIRVPVNDSDGIPLDRPELERVLYHEYTHVVVRHLAGGDVPWWLNEGLAETFSRNLAADRLDALRHAYFEQALFALQDIEANQLPELPIDRLRLAYQQAHFTVDHLWNRYGQRNLVTLLSAISDGGAAEAALQRIYRRNYATLQRELDQRLAH